MKKGGEEGDLYYISGEKRTSARREIPRK